MSRVVEASDPHAKAIGGLWAGRTVKGTVLAQHPIGRADAKKAITVLLGFLGGEAPGPIDVSVATAAMPRLAARALRALGPGATTRAWLTERERETLRQLLLGRRLSEIAGALGRSPHTVNDHVKSLYRKVGARTRGELISRAMGVLAKGRR